MFARSESVPPAPRSLNPAAAGRLTGQVALLPATANVLTLMMFVPAPRFKVPATLLLLEAILAFQVAAVMELLLAARVKSPELRLPLPIVIVDAGALTTKFVRPDKSNNVC